VGGGTFGQWRTALSLNGVQLHLRSWGDAERRPPLLLLHAGGETSHSWTPLAEAWAGARRVYALDFRGHGESERTPSYSLEVMRDDVVGVLDTFDLDEVWIVGHSLGGMVGYLIASMRRPELTRLVLEEAPPPLPIVPAREIPEDPGEDFGFDWNVISDLYAQRNHPDPSWWEDLKRIDIPVLVLAGGESSHRRPGRDAGHGRLDSQRDVGDDRGGSQHPRGEAG
jgi:3-oxoadipate enol-lactonase